MRERLVGTTLFVAAALLDLPIVYVLIADGAESPGVTLLFGFIAMGLAWGGGFFLEAKRRGFSLFIGAVGALQVGAALAPSAVGLDARVRPYLALAGVLSSAALVVVLRKRATA